MKIAILLPTLLLFCMATFGQQNPIPNPKFKTVYAPEHQIQENLLQSHPTHYSKSLKPTPPEKGANAVNIINIGTSATAYGCILNGSYLWADNNLKTVTNFHRFGGALQGSNNSYGYDISTDAGLTWANQIMCFSNSQIYPIRHVQHGIFNPTSNVDPNEAYVSYFGLESSGILRYYYGRAKIGDQSDITENWIYPSATDSLFFYDPEGFVITQTGEIWVTDFSISTGSGTMEYFNKMIVSHGVWNESLKDFEFQVFTLDCPTINDYSPIDSKVAFSPDGQNGWIGVISDNGGVPISANRSFYPILWKTTDAGQTWEGPISVAIAGEDGIDEVKDFLSDEELEELYGYIPDRDSIEFTTAYNFDLHVDAFGNPHIAVVMGITGEEPYSIVTDMSETSGYIFAAPFDITIESYPTEQWFAYELGRLKTFLGYFDVVTVDNRIQIASSWDGLYMMITWADTDLPGMEDNQQPDIWFRGIDVVSHWMTGNGFEAAPTNVTEFSEGMWQAYYFNLSHYAFNVENTDRLFTVPLTYVEMDPEDITQPVQYKYITDFVANFEIWGITDSQKPNIGFNVTDCFPNPSSNSITFAIDVVEKMYLDFAVYNPIAQKVFELPGSFYPPGTHPISIDVSGFDPGVYILKVASGDAQVTRKMIVK